ncbi:MAG: insulinase family protein [Gemmatimonadota bacterium]|nr:insulinase family protein [Gemmatimonadota bacterium]
MPYGRTTFTRRAAAGSLLTLFLLFPQHLVSQDLPAGVTQGAAVEGITEYQLDNGMRVLLFPDQSKQQVTVNITYMVGSRHEAYGETGMAHLLEHLVFKGTPDHPEIWKELDEHGAFPNGTTWLDRTNYFETFPATDENLAWALDLEADRMVNSFIAAEDLESEMTVVRNEFELGENSPARVLDERTASTAYLWHNYGNSTIGARADIENVPIERLQGFYRKYYQPDNAILVVAGRFDPDLALSLVATEFGPIPRPDRSGANQLFETYTAEPAQDGERTVTLRRVGDEQIATAVYHIPAGSHEDYAAISVLSHILSTRPAGRLYSRIVEPGLAASTSAASWRFKEPGLLEATVRVPKDKPLQPAVDEMLATLGSFVEQPPTDEEVNRAKVDFQKNIELAFNDPQRIALQLSEWMSMGDWRMFFLHRDRLEAVTPDAVRRVAATYLHPSNRTLGFFYPVDETPERVEVPPAPDVTALVAGYTGREAVAEGEAFDPTPANLDARTQRLAFDSGFELALLPKENRGDAVTVSLSLRFGTEGALRGRAAAAELVPAMLRRGTLSRTRQEIEDELDRLKAQLGFGGGALSAAGNIQTIRDNLSAVLGLLHEMLREPAFDEAEFQTLKQESVAAVERQMSEPQALAVNTFQRLLNPWPEDHPRYVPTLEEQKARLEAVTLADVRSFWERFYGAQGGTMSIVGDFDAEELTALTREMFGSWTAVEPYARVADPYREIEKSDQDIETPDKANAMMIAAQPVRMKDGDPDYPAMALGDYMLGGGGLSSRLATRIRQELGLSYGVGSQFVAGPLDDAGVFLTYAIFAPENADAVSEAVQAVIAEVLEGGFTTEEIEAAKRGFLDAQQNARASDGTVAGQLNGQLFTDRTYQFTADQEAAVRALTGEQILNAMRRYIDPAKISIVRAGDFAGAEAPTS